MKSALTCSHEVYALLVVAIEASGEHVRLLQAIQKDKQLARGKVAEHPPIRVGREGQGVADRHHLCACVSVYHKQTGSTSCNH